MSTVVKNKNVRRVAGLFALANQIEVRLAQAHLQVDTLTRSIPPAHGLGMTGIAGPLK